MAIPVEIDPCPITEAIVEIRFRTTIPKSVVFGVIFSKLRDEWGDNIENLPILELPEQIRESQADLKNKPHFRIRKGKYIIQIGPDVLSIIVSDPYPGWKDFSNVIFRNLKKFQDLKISSSIDRLGIRYINFFKEENVFNLTDLKISLKKVELTTNPTHIRTEIKKDDFVHTLNISNNSYRVQNGNRILGSIIDIDTYRIGVIDSHKLIKSFLEKGHNSEKEVFFSLLKTEYINQLNPRYE